MQRENTSACDHQRLRCTWGTTPSAQKTTVGFVPPAWSAMTATESATPARRARRLPAITRVVQNAVIDLRFGAALGGTYLWNRRATCSDYALLEQIFADRVRTDDVLVDVGSGGGRVINHWLRKGHQGRIYGLEYDSALAAKSSRRLRKFTNVNIVAGDATVDLPDDGTLYYLFNPFGREAMSRFADRLGESIVRNPRKITVLYFNCKHLDVVALDPRCSLTSVQKIAHPSGAGQDLAEIAVHPLTTVPTSPQN